MKHCFQQYQALAYDMDGVLVDTEHLHQRSEIMTCRELGLQVPESEWINFKGRRLEDIFSYILETYVPGDVKLTYMCERSMDVLIELIKSEVPVVPGALEFLAHSRGQFAKIGLSTSSAKRVQTKVFDVLDLHRYFDAVVSGSDLQHGKPHPEAYLLVARQLGVTSAECMVLEDSDNGIKSAKAAGCFAIGITTSFSEKVLKEAGADLVVANYAMLADALGFLG